MTVLRRAPRMAEPTGRALGFLVEDEPRGWTLTACGADGRRLGRPLKGMSSAGGGTLLRSLHGATDAELERLAVAWVQACRQGVTNQAVLTSFLDAVTAIRGEFGTPAPS